MRRPHNGCLPPTGRRHRQHRTRDLPDRNPRTRTWYDRLLHRCPPPPKVLAVLNVLLDEARDAMADVTITQDRLLARLLADSPDPVWGWSITSLRRVLRRAEQLSWLSIEDRPIPGRGTQVNCYRLHVPATHQAVWHEILDHAETARSRGTKNAHNRRATGGGDRTATTTAYLTGDNLPPAGEADLRHIRNRVAGHYRGGDPPEEILAELRHTYGVESREVSAGLDELTRLRAAP